MEEVNYTSAPAHVVQSEAQAKLLTDWNSFRYFAPFLARTCTVSVAAQEVGCKLDTMFYRVKTFLEVGLLSVAHTEKRAGRSVKHYRSSHDAYYVPWAATDFEETTRRSLRLYEEVIADELARTVRALDRQGWRFFRDKSGEVSSHTAKGETHALDYELLPQLPYCDDAAFSPTAELFTDTLLLTNEEAKALLSQLYQLRLDNKFERTPERKPYLLRLVMVPLEP